MSARNVHDVLVRPVVSEKAYDEQPLSKYRFEIHPKANKAEVKSAVETLFKVTVVKVNVSWQRGKGRRVGLKRGMTPSWKKAVITLKPGDHIELFERI